MEKKKSNNSKISKVKEKIRIEKPQASENYVAVSTKYPISNKFLPVLFLLITFFSSFLAWKIFLRTTGYEKMIQKEREMLFFSENALYYSFYKQLINSDTLGKGVQSLISTDRIQYPDNINVIKEYNIYAELTLGFTYRLLTDLGVTPDPMDFYLKSVFLISGLAVGLIFIISYKVNTSISSAIISILFFISSWPYSSRAINSPALRENFAVPLLLLTLLLINKIIKDRKYSKTNALFLTVLILLQLLLWQFSLFTVSVTIMGLILVSKPYFSKDIRIISLTTIILIFLVFVLQNRGVSGGSGHVINYLLFRLGFMPGDFHSMMYFCSSAFDGLNLYLIKTLTQNFLTIFAIIGALLMWKGKCGRVWLLWAIGFGLMALIANRFLVLAIPLWAIIAGKTASTEETKKLFGTTGWSWLLVLIVLISTVTSDRLSNSITQRQRYFPDEIGLINWIENSTNINDAFSASMSTNSTVFLSTGRRITNNPFYESSYSRNKNYEVYQMYNRLSQEDLLKNLKNNKTNYLIIDYPICYLRSANGCLAEDLFLNEKKDSSLPPLCTVLSTNNYFELSYENPSYRVFKVLDN